MRSVHRHNTDKSIKVKLLKTRKKLQFVRNVQSDAIMENCSIDERSRMKLMWKSIVCLFSIQVSAAFVMDKSHFTNWKSASVFKKKQVDVICTAIHEIYTKSHGLSL